MVSTYLSYDLINRDMQKSISRVASEAQVKRESDYFKANIGSVKTVDEFMGNYRLYSYAMKAYGLEDMTYAKAFMKKVLESSLTDTSSFVNKLADQKYRDFAAAFQFGSSTATAQTNAQEGNTIQGYKDQIVQEQDNANIETAYYKQTIGTVTSVDGLIQNSRLYDYALKAVGLDPQTYTTSFIKQVLTSDPASATSYVNSLPTATNSEYVLKQKALALRAAFNFNTSGTLNAGVAIQDSTQLQTLTDDYITTVPSHLGTAAALINKSYIDTMMAGVTKVSDITSNDKLFSLVKTALGLSPTMLTSTFTNIVTSDTTTQNNYAYQQGGNAWVAIANMFNFDTSGNVPAGSTAMSSANLTKLENQYLSTYNDAQDASDAALYTYYQSNMSYVTSVDDLLNNPKLYSTALESVGLDPTTESAYKIKRVLESDPNDPKSYVNTLADSRYTALAKSFNFDASGYIRAPDTAQSQPEILLMSKNYVFYKTRFLTGTEQTAAKTAATAESSYFSSQIQSVNNINDLLSNKRLVNFMLTSVGLDPSTVTSDTLKRVFTSDLSDPNSYANKMSDPRFAQLAASFNFNTSGQVKNMDGSGPMDRRALLATINDYYNQTLETEEGDSNTGVRLALYFKREAPKITDAYSILGDTALLQVFKTAFSLPDEFSNLNIDTQAAKVNQYMNLKDLADPTKLDAFINRFTALYDLQNGSSGASSAATLLSSSSGTSISADTLLTLSQLKLS